jgi:hypothetical protein
MMLRVSTPLPGDPDKKHYYVVLTAPAYVSGKGMCVAWVSLSTVAEGAFYDRACLLDAGCHSKVKHRTWVDYSYAKIKPVQEIEQGYAAKTVAVAGELVSEPLFGRIFDGIFASQETNASAESFCRRHSPQCVTDRSGPLA